MIKKLGVTIGILLVILAVAYWFLRDNTTNNNQPKETKQLDPIKQTTTVSLSPKETPTSPDVVVDTVYTTKVNGETIRLPMTTTKDKTTATVTSQIDMTSAVDAGVRAERRNWELGVGLGVHGGSVYVPVELQRNYSKNKAISAEVHLDAEDLKHVNGAEVMHKWRF